MNVDVITPATAETFHVVADRMRLMGQIDGSGLHLVECEVPPGSGTPPHTHPSPELFYVIEGEVTFRSFAPGQPPRAEVAGPGTSVSIPRMAPHNYLNESGRPARMLVFLEPEMVTFFREIATPAPQTRPNFAALGAAMARHRINTLDMAI